MPPRRRLVGVDYGTVRVGLAFADSESGIATPLENYNRRSPTADAERFQRLAAEEAVDLFVVGLPVHLDGGESQKSQEARQFGEWLTELTGVPVEYYDERFTSVEAEQILGAAQLTKKQRKRRLDALAAQIMLSGYLESRGGSQPPQALDDRGE